MTFEEAKITFYNLLPKISDSLGNIRKDLVNRYVKRNQDFSEILGKILTFFPWIEINKNDITYLFEIKYCIDNKILTRPTCPNCGKPVKFSKWYRKYMDYCSKRCTYEHEKLTQEWSKEPDIDNKQKVLDFIKQETYKSQNNMYVDGQKSHKFCKVHKSFLEKVVQKYCSWVEPPFERKISEIIYCLENNITLEKLKCPICGSRVSFNSVEKRYAITCSNKKCQALYSSTKRTEKTKDSVSKAKRIKEELVKTYVKEIKNIHNKSEFLNVIQNLFSDSLSRISSEKAKFLVDYYEIRKEFVNKVKQFVPFVNLYVLNENPSKVLSEIKWSLIHNIESPVCPICGLPLKFQDFATGYNKTCGNPECVSMLNKRK